MTNPSVGRLNALVPMFAFYAAAAGVVVVWRLTALGLLSRQPDLEGTWWLVPALLAAAGIVHLVCGLYVLHHRPGRASQLFACFCICFGLHWGGPLELATGPLRTTLLLFYLLISGVLGATLLLHFALVFPRGWRAGTSLVFLRILYLPMVVATVLGVPAVVSPSESGLRTTARGGFLLLHTLVSNLYSIVALVLFVVLLFGRSMNSIQKRYVGLMIAGMLAAWLPYILASSAGVENADPWNLTVVALPLSFTIAFFGIRGRTEVLIP